MNITVLTGNLARDVELRYTQTNNKAVAQFTVAVKRPFTKDVVDFINCVAWESAAENISKYFSKGDFIQLNGYLTLRQYEDKDGAKKTIAEVIVREWGFGGPKKERDAEPKPEPKPEVKPKQDKEPDLFSNLYDNEFVPF